MCPECDAEFPISELRPCEHATHGTCCESCQERIERFIETGHTSSSDESDSDREEEDKKDPGAVLNPSHFHDIL